MHKIQLKNGYALQQMKKPFTLKLT